MARTVHHVSYDQRDSTHARHRAAGVRCNAHTFYPWHREYVCDYRGPEHTITVLRYSALAFVVADRTGTRPSPQRVTAVFERVTGVRKYKSTDALGEAANIRERVARQRLRDQARVLAAQANAVLAHGVDGDAIEDLYDLDEPTPARHRGSAIYDIW
jgi:hypothetical protein